jgi:endonuclease/exonuclease/phosphatase family metal-dependent hydrolase
MKRALRFIGLLALIFLLYVVVVLVHGTVTDYQPEDVIELEVTHPSSTPTTIQDSTLRFVIWNLGYGALGAESNFFFDKSGMFRSKGRMVRPAETLVRKNVEGIYTTLRSIPADFYLLQEVDYESKRSYFINQFTGVKELFPSYASFFATNYLSPRVPIPILEPWKAYGAVKSGLGTYSRFIPTSATRYQLPGAFSWPMRNFQLDRCVAVAHFPLANGKELVVLNVHNSAYDKTGELKKQQMDFLREYLLELYEAGHYVVVGGDWNQCPPFFQFDAFMPGQSGDYSQINIEADFLPSDWMWVYDPTVPTNRKVGDVYAKGETFVTLIDFFLISPNIRALDISTVDLDFQFSDHQPVYLEVSLLD